MFRSEAILEFCEKNKISILNRKDFPELLAQISDPPEVLFVQGDASLLYRDCFAIVGTRRASVYGLRSAFHFSQELSDAGLVIVSGLARGIDSAAHQGTLLREGKTIAVLGHGHDTVYPRENRSLYAKILEKGGAIISEYPPFSGIKKYFFVGRNRIVAGLSRGTLVIEASEKSGSLITADFANEFGRDVFVIPGQFDDLNYLGSHSLIQTGAKLATSTESILEEYPFLKHRKKTSKISSDSKKVRKILKESFSLEQLFQVGQIEKFNPSLQLKKWLDNKELAEISPQHYMWLKGP